ncbi:MAG: DEAD/DEAH box helicase [Deltaproteobacteria bacterium]|nr:DEAD/DEAH box helicase [Deltaproteobacteria bacterium]
MTQAIRKAAGAQAWSQGSILARSGAVISESATGDELVFKVTPPTQSVALEVVLYPQDDEWECSCDSKRPACSHVAASIIALDQKGSAAELKAASDVGQVHYHFLSHPRGLAFERRLAVGGREEILAQSLTAILSGRVPGPKLTIDAYDIEVDRQLGRSRRTVLTPEVARQLHRELIGSGRTFVDGNKVEVETDSVLPIARVVDDGDGVRLSIERNPEARAYLGSGLALCAPNALRPVVDTTLSGSDHDHLPFAKTYAPAQVAELVTEVLPALRREMAVHIETDRLPGVTRQVPPRIHFEIDHSGYALQVLPLLVYGDPPIARIDDGRLHQIDLEAAAPLRDLDAERELIDGLRNQLNLSVGRKLEVRGRDAQDLATKLKTWHGGDAARGETLEPVFDIADAAGVRFRVRDASDGKERYATGRTVAAAWQGGLDVVPLIGGGFAQLPADWMNQYGHIVADLLAARDESGELPRFALPDVAELASALKAPPPPEFEELAALVEGFETLPPFESPDNLAAVLRPYQERGTAWLAFARKAGLGAVLADDMGLGKTVQALAVMDGKVLVVCPRSVIWTWAEEAERFRPSLEVSVYHGPRRELADGPGLVITTYSILRIDQAKLAEREWDMVVLDEAQAIKNPDSQAARAAYSLDSKFNACLTGTPVENRLEELWSLMHFVCPGLLGSRREFAERYEKPIAEGDGRAIDRLRKRIRPFLLRREKRMVAPELPPRTEAVLHLELDDDERRVYDAVWAATQDEVVKELQQGRGVMAALEALLRLRQAACHSGLLPGRSDLRSTKVERVVAALEEAAADGHKALVFSQWTSLLDRVEPHLRAASIEFTRLDGSTRNRQAVVKNFQSDDGPPVMLISLKAGGTGLTLTAADHVFLLDPWWNPAVEAQAADRTHRIGQDKPVMVYRVVAKDTVEERILELQERKRSLARAALEGGDLAESLSRDDLLELLS